MNLREVRRWARRRRLAASRVSEVSRVALLHSTSRLLQAIYRESEVARLVRDRRGRWSLHIGPGGRLRAPASGPLPFGRLEILGLPRDDTGQPLRSVRAFIRALEQALAGSAYEKVFPSLRSDFENSVANVLLNRLLGSALGATARAIEPAFQGHQYYPFPALRIGPTLPQVLACSHLNREPVDIPLLEIDACRFMSATYQRFESCLTAYSGLAAHRSGALELPVHPWHLALSPVVRGLLDKRWARLSGRTLKAMPLASQRTCRVLQTGYDVKLPIDCTITGERRLLFALNCENATVVSALAKALALERGDDRLDFQHDVAAIVHAQPALAAHLSAIVRAPVHARPGEVVVPAINLWAGRCEALPLLRGRTASEVEAFFEQYCAALMRGPVRYCSELGLAFEPHLQNVFVAFRAGRPAGIVLRDLDNTVLDARRVKPLLREHGLALPARSWRHMPSFDDGAKRMVQAMLFGHLGEVMWCVRRDTGLPMSTMDSIVESTWAGLCASAPSASARRFVCRLRGWSDCVKATLHTRLHRATALEFVER